MTSWLGKTIYFGKGEQNEIYNEANQIVNIGRSNSGTCFVWSSIAQRPIIPIPITIAYIPLIIERIVSHVFLPNFVKE